MNQPLAQIKYEEAIDQLTSDDQSRQLKGLELLAEVWRKQCGYIQQLEHELMTAKHAIVQLKRRIG